MAKYKIIFEGEEEDEVFDSYEEADEYAKRYSPIFHLGKMSLYFRSLAS